MKIRRTSYSNIDSIMTSEYLDDEVKRAIRLNRARVYVVDDDSKQQFIVLDGGKSRASQS